MRTEKKQTLAVKRRWRIRQKVQGTAERPRMSVRFTGQHIYVQFIDDHGRQTIAATSTRSKAIADRAVLKANVTSAQRVGTAAAAAARAKGVTQVVFDRSGARYHGKVKALAEAAREGGLHF